MHFKIEIRYRDGWKSLVWGQEGVAVFATRDAAMAAARELIFHESHDPKAWRVVPTALPVTQGPRPRRRDRGVRVVSRRHVERAAGVALSHGWILDGAGPARWGWGRVAACRVVYLGRTLADAARALGVEVAS